MNPENALVSRRIAYETDDDVTIIEVWDTSHPESPWVAGWPPEIPRVNPHIRAIKMTRLEYDSTKIPLKGWAVNKRLLLRLPP